ncbi:hypothetical protein AVEN_229777-1 [Araneus ventricosus]|uniref:Uncharacterized protein n=1 Tax=Araneus ventricosus TaxID=182803 RepID=A0A4Y2K7A4_ARAVE|nr:hypothetical protein AVEN_229777-1 [Araneus ventricosus]
MKIPLAERLYMKDQRFERKMVIGGVDVIATEKREKGKRKQMEDKRIKRKMAKPDPAHVQSMEPLELNTMSSSSYTDTDVITLEYQSQNCLDFTNLARECDRYGISDREAASFASAVLQDIGIVHEGENSHVLERNTIRRQNRTIRRHRKKL